MTSQGLIRQKRRALTRVGSLLLSTVLIILFALTVGVGSGVGIGSTAYQWGNLLLPVSSVRLCWLEPLAFITRTRALEVSE